jgi:hypothetical protein
MNLKFITAPKYFTAPKILEFLEECVQLFPLKGTRTPGYVFDLMKVRECSMLGTLVFYKIIEYTLTNNCFYRPSIAFNYEEPVTIEAFKRFGFWDLIMDYMEDRSGVERSYKKLEIKVEDNFIIAPQALLRDGNFSSRALRENFLPQIEEYYSFNPKAVSMIFLCLSEVLLNFWEHAVHDTKSIIVANGRKNNIEIACADTGRGIISTLEEGAGLKARSPSLILAKSVQKGITSKKGTDHMGFGLWILDQLVKLVKGRLHIYSQGAYYINDFGKIKTGDCAYWGGTIVYLSLPLNDPKTLSDIEGHSENSKLQKLKINWS